jgi:hypothetical protein
MSNFKRFGYGVFLTTTAILLSACDAFDGDNDKAKEVTVEVELMSFTVTVTNLTNAQPFSPVGVALHSDSVWWELGQSATDALEQMAEGGDNSALLNLPEVISADSSDTALAPGESISFTLTLEAQSGVYFSTAAMLVNTNDGFTGITGVMLDDMDVGDTTKVNRAAYDAGTEANTEAMGTMPGPADGGEGYNAVRDDIGDLVAMHSGVVTQDDGNSESVLTGLNKFDNPVVSIFITRLE